MVFLALFAFGDVGVLFSADPGEYRDRLSFEAFENQNGDSMPYRLFVPKDYDANQSYPVILYLHGYGENGTNNRGQFRHPDALRFVADDVQKKHPCFFVAPQNPKGLWPGKSCRVAMDLLDALDEKYSFDPNRRYVTGLSSGGMGTFDCLTRRPEYFAAAIPICGRGDTTKAESIADVAVWGFCGDKDSFRIGMRAMNEAAKKGGAMWKYTEYKGVGHNSWRRAYATDELPEWLFSQKRKKND
jgi:predicted peptidase